MSGQISIFFLKKKKSLRSCKAYLLKMNFLVISAFLQVAIITDINLLLGEAYTVEWDIKIRDDEKIDCYPDENGASAENCTARGCIWEVTMLLGFTCMEISTPNV